MKLFGYDKYNKAIWEGSIIKFFDIDQSRYRIGHIWCHNDSCGWQISFNHLFSETSQDVKSMNIRNIKVIGFGQDNEYLMKGYLE